MQIRAPDIQVMTSSGIRIKRIIKIENTGKEKQGKRLSPILWRWEMGEGGDKRPPCCIQVQPTVQVH